MNIKKSIHFSLFCLMIIVFLACKKDGIPLSDNVNLQKDKRGLFEMNAFSASCSGTETKVTHFDVSSNPDYFTRQIITKITDYYCDGELLESSKRVIQDDHYQGSEPDPGPTVSLGTVVPGYLSPGYIPSCNGPAFGIDNIIHYNSAHFESRPVCAVMLSNVLLEVSMYSYEGPYILDDLSVYGTGSVEKIRNALLGHYCAEIFGSARVATWASNVPALSGFGVCDQIPFKLAFLRGASDYGGHSSYGPEELYNYYINEIMAYRM